MANFDMYFSDAEREAAEQEKRAKVTSLVGGNPTEEEMYQAFEEMFQKEWRKNT